MVAMLCAKMMVCAAAACHLMTPSALVRAAWTMHRVPELLRTSCPAGELMSWTQTPAAQGIKKQGGMPEFDTGQRNHGQRQRAVLGSLPLCICL